MNYYSLDCGIDGRYHTIDRSGLEVRVGIMEQGRLIRLIRLFFGDKGNS